MFGKEMLTPVVQVGPASQFLTFRDIFTAVAVIALCVLIALETGMRPGKLNSLRTAA